MTVYLLLCVQATGCIANKEQKKGGGGLYGCLLTKYLKFYATVEFIYENNETAAGR